MKRMIETIPDFQYSVNIQYDLNNPQKIRDFIPTAASLRLLDDILASLDAASNRRARILIGAYGKGKSHIVLAILAVLMKRTPRGDFARLDEKLAEFPEIRRRVDGWYEKGRLPLLPVLISGSGAGLSQSFIAALQNALKENGLLDLMPETNYRAAARTVEKWREEYPETFARFAASVEESPEEFAARLAGFDGEAYRRFVELYPSLSSGGCFNPFLGFDVAELYESVAKELRRKNLYGGLYVVYDEFSKYLESNIAHTSAGDTKMLQDFAEKCCRSGETQLHVLLISHKEIANYIDILPKDKTDGWRGISERFEHVVLNNEFSQVYEIISSVIQKDGRRWDAFCHNHGAEFERLLSAYRGHDLFRGLSEEDVRRAVFGCYPLHPVSLFILPRLSERIAQNERTLFTFLASRGGSTLPDFLEATGDRRFALVTPDVVYDYFEPLFRKEMHSGFARGVYILSQKIVGALDGQTLEQKIVKTIALIYILEQFETLKPIREEIVRIYSVSYTDEEIGAALENLVEKELALYLRQSNSFLRLKERSGVDVAAAVRDETERRKNAVAAKDVLNAHNANPYLYPYRYNDEKEMTRFFEFVFLDESEVSEDTDWNVKSESIRADGVVYGILATNGSSGRKIRRVLKAASPSCPRAVFAVLKKPVDMTELARKLDAIAFLRRNAANDPTLQEEYQMMYDDVLELVDGCVDSFLRPECRQAVYIHGGEEREFLRKSQLSNLLSDICGLSYPDSPVIKNEAVNKNEITAIAQKSRDKVVAALLRGELERNLGLTGYGPDVSIMRSTLLRARVLSQGDGVAPSVNLRPEGDPCNVIPVLSAIEAFVLSAYGTKSASFSDLYKTLAGSEGRIGARRGIIPIYMACVFRKYKKGLSIVSGENQFSVTAPLLSQINGEPERFSLRRFDWDSEKESYVQAVEALFSDFAFPGTGDGMSNDRLIQAMHRWFLSLPKFAKEMKTDADGAPVEKSLLRFLKAVRSAQSANRLLFDQLPEIFGEPEAGAVLVEKIREAKRFFDGALPSLRERLAEEAVRTFRVKKKSSASVASRHLPSVLRVWAEALPRDVSEQVFADGTEKFVRLCLGADGAGDGTEILRNAALLATGLRMEDWNEATAETFLHRLAGYKATAEQFAHGEKPPRSENASASCELKIVGADGNPVVRRFEVSPRSARGRLLYNKIRSELDAMGLALSEQEKRQVLLDLLQELC